MTTMTDRQRDGVEKFGRAVPFAGLGTSISGEMNGIGISDRIGSDAWVSEFRRKADRIESENRFVPGNLAPARSSRSL